MTGEATRFKGKVVVVTGASSGMGLAVAERIASEGGSVVAVARKAEALETAAEKIKAKATGDASVAVVVADASTEAGSKEAVHTAVEKFGTIDGLFANVGTHCQTPFVEMEEAEIDTIFNANTKSVIWGVKYAMKAMIKLGVKGSIVVNSSTMSYKPKAAFKGWSLYAASKAAADMLVQYAAMEGVEHGIRVNAVRPGIVRTNIMGPDMTDEKFDAFAAANQMIGRAGKPEEIAGLVGFLLSDDASFISGSLHTADGLWAIT